MNTLVYPVISRWVFELFPLLVIMTNIAVNICVHVFFFLCVDVYIFLLGMYLGVKLLGSMATVC